jgi:hypothetical protein
MTNNIADILVFESLQSEQHNRTGVSQMAVFNNQKDVDDIKKASDDYAKVLDKAIAAKNKAIEAKNKAMEAKKKYFQIHDTIMKNREKQSTTIDPLKDKEAKKVFLQEYNAILGFKNTVYDKEKQLDK